MDGQRGKDYAEGHRRIVQWQGHWEEMEVLVGALVRLVREIPYLYEHGAELPDHQERIAAWLSEAKDLVGKVEG